MANGFDAAIPGGEDAVGFCFPVFIRDDETFLEIDPRMESLAVGNLSDGDEATFAMDRLDFVRLGVLERDPSQFVVPFEGKGFPFVDRVDVLDFRKSFHENRVREITVEEGDDFDVMANRG